MGLESAKEGTSWLAGDGLQLTECCDAQRCEGTVKQTARVYIHHNARENITAAWCTYTRMQVRTSQLPGLVRTHNLIIPKAHSPPNTHKQMRLLSLNSLKPNSTQQQTPPPHASSKDPLSLTHVACKHSLTPRLTTQESSPSCRRANRGPAVREKKHRRGKWRSAAPRKSSLEANHIKP